MAQPFVTIGIPIRNGEEIIGQTLDNLLLSNYPKDRYEIIIGNHGSTDRTQDILKKYEQNHEHIISIDLPFMDPCRSFVRNKITEKANGEIIIFIDNDILAPRDFIIKHVELHQKEDAIVGGYTYGKQAAFKLDLETFEGINPKDITQSYEYLKSQTVFADFREVHIAKIPNTQGPVVHMETSFAPFRFFYSCNISVRRETLIRLGGFDENYKTWGLEDDDLAYRYQLAGYKMIFSREAWGFHYPHPVSPRPNMNSWRKNREYFFHKYKTRELEFFYLNAMDIRTGVFSLELFHKLAFSEEQKNTVNKINLSPGKGSRLGLLIFDEDNAKALNLTHAFMPGLHRNVRPYQKEDCTYFSLIGMKIPFKNKSIDETILILDTLIFIDFYRLDLILMEVVRVSKNVLIYSGETSQDKEYEFLTQRIKDRLELLNLNDVNLEWIEI